MQETRVPSLGQEDPLEEGMATHSSGKSWKSHEKRSLAGATVLGVTKSLLQLGDSTTTIFFEFSAQEL